MSNILPSKRKSGLFQLDETEDVRGIQPPDEIIATRCGAVLGKQTILKSDHFPGCQNMTLTPLIDGAPNFRKVEGLPVYGVAIPTRSGLVELMERLGGRDRAVLWHNMREEPVLYVNGEPYVLRDVECPFANMEYTGIDRNRVEEMENRLKAEVEVERERYGNQVLVSGETDDGQVVDLWIKLDPSDTTAIQTPKDVYASLVSQGYKVDYLRVPMTDEKAPKEKVVDLLTSRISGAPSDAALMFNCQMGRGRTTTGMVIACLVVLQQRPPALPLAALPARPSASSPQEESLLQGDFPCVRSLTRLLDHGAQGKRKLDEVLDRCAAMQNLREAILSYRRYLASAKDEAKKAAAYRRGLEYLERYYVLISFSAYLIATAPPPGGNTLQGGGGSIGSVVSFEKWRREHPELDSILQRMLWRNPVSALNQSTSVLHQSGAETDTTSVVDARNGAVLSALTILKEEPYPGLQQEGLPLMIQGAPNFRQVGDLPVFGMAIPTRQGVVNTLKLAQSRFPDHQVLWVNLREEPVIFVHGKPYVLREAARPFHNLQEYSGITVERVEGMEARLKMDAATEAACYMGRLLVCRESDGGQLEGAWQEGVNRDSVLTFPELFADPELQQGLSHAPKYLRVPITHQRAPKKTDFDRLTQVFTEDKVPKVLVFSCQGGAGRTTTATVIACLCLHRQMSAPVTIPQPCSRQMLADGADGKESSDLLGSLSRGEYGCVRRLLHILPRGQAAKTRLDNTIDLCGAVENLRLAVLEKRGKFTRDLDLNHVEDLDQTMKMYTLKYGADLLERYVVLIAYTAWLDSDDYGNISFTQWLGNHPEIRQIKKMILANPMQALEYSLPKDPAGSAASKVLLKHLKVVQGVPQPAQQAGSQPDSPNTPTVDRHFALPPHFLGSKDINSPEVKDMEGVESLGDGSKTSGEWKAAEAGEEDQVLQSREGSLLCQGMVLKRHQELPVKMVGARSSLPLYSSTSLTVKQLKQMLEQLCQEAQAEPDDINPTTTQDYARTDTEQKRSLSFGHDDINVVVTDLREEPTVYINSTPFTLAEIKDLRGVKEVVSVKYAGIAGHTLEELEDALRRDVLQELRADAGRTMLHCNTGTNPSDGTPHWAPFWHTLEGEAAAQVVRTPRQVFALLASGLPISYRRLPLSSARNITTPDLDSIRLYADCFFPPVTGDDQRRPSEELEEYGARLEGTQQEQKEEELALAGGGESPPRNRSPPDLAKPVALPHKKKFLWLSQPGDESTVGYAMATTACVLIARSSGGQIDIPHAFRDKSPPNSPPRAQSTLSPVKNSLSNMGVVGSPAGQRTGRDMRREARAHGWTCGEYRDVLSLVRVLDNGLKAKQLADWAIDACQTAGGNVRHDIYQCKVRIDAKSLDFESASSAAMNYLRRYFNLITFCGYLESQPLNGPLKASAMSVGRSSFSGCNKTVCFSCQSPMHIARECPGSFACWVANRQELQHLFKHLQLGD